MQGWLRFGTFIICQWKKGHAAPRTGPYVFGGDQRLAATPVKTWISYLPPPFFAMQDLLKIHRAERSFLRNRPAISSSKFDYSDMQLDKVCELIMAL
jgi:hypothetical protein